MAPTITGNNNKSLRTGDPEPPLAPAKARIYSMKFCPWAERTLLYCAAKGIEVEIVNIHLADKPEWYFNKHPKGQVPAFEKDGQIVIESSIVCEYLDGAYPDIPILPTDPYLRAQQRLLLDQVMPIAPAFYALSAAQCEKIGGEEREAKIKSMEDVVNAIEKLIKDDYFGGSSPGYVDWMIFPFFERLALFTPLFPLPTPFPSDHWPRLSAWFGRISSHPAARAVVQPKDTHIEFLKSRSAGNPDYDIGSE